MEKLFGLDVAAGGSLLLGKQFEKTLAAAYAPAIDHVRAIAVQAAQMLLSSPARIAAEGLVERAWQSGGLGLRTQPFMEPLAVDTFISPTPATALLLPRPGSLDASNPNQLLSDVERSKPQPDRRRLQLGIAALLLMALDVVGHLYPKVAQDTQPDIAILAEWLALCAIL